MSQPKNKPRVPVSAKIQLKKKDLPKTPTKKGNRYFTLFFFIFAAILYGNTVLNKWSIDDNYVTGPQNEQVTRGFAAIPEIFATNYVREKGNIGSQTSDYRPIVKSTFAIEYGLWGGNKAGRSHIINMLIYFWLSTVLFFVLKRLMKNLNILFPFLITVLFMAHPIHTEVVASLKNRDEMLAFLCGLYTLKFFLDYTEKKKFYYFIFAVIIFFIGYLCKSSILPFLLIYPLVLYFFTDMKPKNLLFIFLAVLAAGLLAHFLPRMFLPHGIRVNSFIENPLYIHQGFWIRTGTALMSLIYYLRLLLFPYPLIYYYGFNMIPLTGWGNIWVLLSFVIHAGLLIYAVLKLREKHILSFAILFYFIFIAMYSNILIPMVGIVAERFVFAASLGFCIALVYGIFRLFRTDPKSLTIEFNERAKILVVIMLLLIPATAMTVSRNRDWRNLGDLYKADIKYQHNSVKANIEFGEYLISTVYRDPNFQQHGEVNEFKQQVIVSHLRRAIALYPGDYQVLNDLGTVYLNFSEKIDSAVYFIKKAMVLKPGLQPAWVNMALAYRKKNQADSAIYCYRKILSMNPDELNAVFKMADLYYEKGDFQTAVKLNEDVMKTHPQLDVPYFNIGYYFIVQRDTTQAIRYWEQAFQRNPTYEVSLNLSNMYKGRGDMERANYYYGFAMEAARKRNGNGQ